MGPQLPPQLPITTPIRSYICILKMPREKGKEWNHVRVIELKDKRTSTSLRWSACTCASTASMSL